MSSSALTPWRRTMQACLLQVAKDWRQDGGGENKRHHDGEVGDDIPVGFVGAEAQRRVDRAGDERPQWRI